VKPVDIGFGRTYIRGVLLFRTPEWECVPRFGSPWSPEEQKWFEHVKAALESGGFPPAPPHDPLQPYHKAAREQRKRAVCIRLEPWLIDLVKAMARQHEMPYQQILRLWMYEGLRRALREGREPGERS
jgi:hypothetical protein